MGLGARKGAVQRRPLAGSEISGLGHSGGQRQRLAWSEDTHRLAEALEQALTDPTVTRFEQLVARLDAQIAPQTGALRRSVLRAFVKSARNIETSEAWLLETAQQVLDNCADAQAEEPK